MDKFDQIRSLLGSVKGALDVVQQVGNMPGVKLIPVVGQYVSTIVDVTEVAEQAILLGQDATSKIQAMSNTFSKPGGPLQEDLDALNASIAKWRAELKAPLPSADPDEPE